MLGVRRRGFSSTVAPVTAAVLTALGQTPALTGTNPPASELAELYPQYYDLNIISPRASGTGGAPGAVGVGLQTWHPNFHAYPGITKKFMISWHGGAFPVVSAVLTNAASGMTVESFTCPAGWTMYEIVWVNPQADATPTLTITDILGNTSEATWTCVVGTSQFKFVDSVNGTDTASSGTLASPYRTLNYARLNAGGNIILYLRTGTYTTVESSNGGAGFSAMQFSGASHPQSFVAYPGESPVIDGQWVQGGGDANGDVPMLWHAGSSAAYYEGIRFTRFYDKVVWWNSTDLHGAHFYRCTFDGIGRGQLESVGSNAAILSWNRGTRWATVVQACDFDIGALTIHCAMKCYTARSPVFMGNKFHSGTMTNIDGTIAMKEGNTDWYIMGNWFADPRRPAIGGNNNDLNPLGSPPNSASGDFGWNQCYGGITDSSVQNLYDCIYVCRLFSTGNPRGALQVYRNTFIGQALLETLNSADGLLTWKRNVLINTDSSATPQPYFYYYNGITDATRLVLESNLTAVPADGAVTATGLLQGSYRTLYGPGSGDDRGHERP